MNMIINTVATIKFFLLYAGLIFSLLLFGFLMARLNEVYD
jgi:hypothetical protein